MAARSLDWEVSSALIQPGGGRRLRDSVAQQLAVLDPFGETCRRTRFSRRGGIRGADRHLPVGAAGGVSGPRGEGSGRGPPQGWYPGYAQTAMEPAGPGPARLAIRRRTEPEIPARSVRAANVGRTGRGGTGGAHGAPMVSCGRWARRSNGWRSMDWPRRRAVTPTSNSICSCWRPPRTTPSSRWRVPSCRLLPGRRCTSSASGLSRAIRCRIIAPCSRRSRARIRTQAREAMAELVRLALQDTEISLIDSHQ